MADPIIQSQASVSPTLAPKPQRDRFKSIKKFFRKARADCEYVYQKVDEESQGRITQAVDDLKNKTVETVNDIKNREHNRRFYKIRTRMTVQRKHELINQMIGEDIPKYNRFEMLANEGDCDESDGLPLVYDQDYGYIEMPAKKMYGKEKYCRAATAGNYSTIYYRRVVELKDNIEAQLDNEDDNEPPESAVVQMCMNEVYDSLKQYLRIKFMYEPRTVELFIKMRSESRTYLQRRFDLECDTKQEYDVIRNAVRAAFTPGAAEGQMRMLLSKDNVINNISKHNKTIGGAKVRNENFLHRNHGEGIIFEDGEVRPVGEIITGAYKKVQEYRA